MLVVYNIFTFAILELWLVKFLISATVLVVFHLTKV